MKVLAIAMGIQAVPFVALGAQALGSVYCVQGCGVEPEAGGSAGGGERGGGTSVTTARAEVNGPGEQGLTGLSTPEQMQSARWEQGKV